jgi:aspartyl-tRNA(Asn)/glutamyl-tRNA(Gln) amidotransferase subunit B
VSAVATTYETVIGLEVHAQLLTRSKMFCGCPATFGARPNTQTCPVCLGMPGVLPVVNRRAVEFGIRTALAFGCRVNESCRFARKHYYYPDMPKNYQISQYEEPLAEDGCLEIDLEGGTRAIGIQRLHLEEDVGKLLHEGTLETAQASLVDFNRSGVPLMETVSRPDLQSPEEAAAYLRAFRSVLIFLGVCDGNMEEGSLRCDANVSIRPRGSTTLGTKVEIKNLNSFRNVQRALEFEVRRQAQALDSGERIVQETRLWEADRGYTRSMRSKEFAHDYRYFPEPDLLPVAIDQEMNGAAQAALPELPAARAERFVDELDLSDDSAQLLAFRAELGEYFEAALAAGAQPAPPAQALANWIASDLLGRLEEGLDPADSQVEPRALATLVGLVSARRISVGAGRQVLDKLVAEGGDPVAIVDAEGLAAIDGEDELDVIVAAAIAANADAAERVRSGNAKAIGPIIGYVMRETRGRVDGSQVTRLVYERLGV